MAKDQSIKNICIHFLPYLIFFTGSFVYFGFFADYVEFYQEKLSLFVFSHDYLIDNLSQPGSLLIYLGRFLTTFYYCPLIGAAIISLIICLIIYMISLIISSLTEKESILLPLLSGTAFFILHSNYHYLLYNSLGVLLQLVFLYVTTKYLKGFIPVILFPFWYFFTGGFAWIFGVMYGFHLALKSIRKEWPEIISIFALCLLIIYLLKEFFLFQTFKNLLIFPLSDEGTGSQIRLFIPVIVLIILIPLTGKIKIRFPVWIKQKAPLKIIIISLITLLLVGVPALLLFDMVNKEYFHAEKLFFQRKFSEVASYISKYPTTNRLTIFLNNISLCETGKLNDQLFYFPQSPDGLSLFLKWEMHGEVLRRGGYFYYTTGMINEAQRWAFENMVMKGITPEDLRMLIKTEIINGNYKVASKYISILKKTLFYSSEAKKYERLLFDDEAVRSDPELGARRKEKIEHDFFSITDNPYVNLEMVLSRDSLNRKTFEYKMAYLMLTENYSGIASGLAKLESQGFTKIPVHLEEAALVCRLSNSGALPDMGSLKIDPQTEVRFNQFLQTFQLYGNNLKTAQPFLKQKFGNTFWYYAFYH
jgi:hypothetical protein